MKTKIKRHSRAVISVILAISMLVSCMMVGLIATDAARVNDEAVGYSGCKVKGTWDSWVLHDITSSNYSVTLAANTTYSFVFVAENNDQFSANTTIKNSTDYNFSRNGNDAITLQTAAAGTYTFWFNGFDGGQTSMSVHIEYPEDTSATTWTAVGDSTAIFGTAWAPTATDNDLTQSGTTWSKTWNNVQLSVGTIKYKVAKNHAWTTTYPSSDATKTVSTAGLYNVTVTYNKSTNAVDMTLVPAATYTLTVPATVANAVVKATYNGTTANEGGTLSGIPAGASVTISVTPDTGYSCTNVTSTPSATISGSGKTWTLTMPSANVTNLSFTLGNVGTKTVYFNNANTEYSMISAFVDYNGGKPLGAYPGQTMTRLANSNIWSIEVPEDAYDIIFIGDNGYNTGTLTIPAQDNPMYTAGSDKTSPSTNGTWGTYTARTNEITVSKGSTLNNSNLFTGITATMYDYYTDGEVTSGWLNGIGSREYSKNNGKDYDWNPFTKFNDALDAYARQKGVTYPLYFGNLNTTNGGTDLIKVKSGTYNGQQYYNWNYAANNSNGLSNKNNAATGLSGKTIQNNNSRYYKSGATNENGAAMAFFDEDFLSGVNSQGTALATILRSSAFPVRKTNEGGTTTYPNKIYVRADGSDGTVNWETLSAQIWVRFVNSSGNKISDVKMTKEGNYWTATVPSGTTKISLVRMPNNYSSTDNIDYSKKWNQAADIAATTDTSSANRLYKVTSWDANTQPTRTDIDASYGTTTGGHVLYEFDSTDGKDNAYIRNINKTSKTAEIDYYNNTNKVYAAGIGSNSGAGFFPFDYNSIQSHINDNPHDLGFGMKLEIPFTLEANGLNSDGTHQKFNFSGDDDLWVYVDGQLVLDLGGAHLKSEGSIDFNTRTVSATNKQAISSAVRNGSFASWFDNTNPNAVHTMTIYYMERGMYDSNLKFSFSFHAIPNQLKVEKKVRTANVNSGFYILNSNTQSDYTVDNGRAVTWFEKSYQYEDFDVSQTNVGTPKTTPIKYTVEQAPGSSQAGSVQFTSSGTAADNYLTSYKLRNDFTAYFMDQYNAGTSITLSENPESHDFYRYDQSIAVYDDANNGTVVSGTGDATNGYKFAFAETHSTGIENLNIRARFTNQMKTHDLYVYKATNITDTTTLFTLNIKVKTDPSSITAHGFTAYPLYCTVDGDDVQLSTDGDITIKAGQELIIPKIPENAVVQITETLPNDSAYAYTGTDVAYTTGTSASGTAITNGIQFAMGSGDMKATVNNAQADPVIISHQLKPGSVGKADTYVTAAVTDSTGSTTRETYAKTPGRITVDPQYIKRNSTDKLVITLETTPIGAYAFEHFWEQITSTMNQLAASGTPYTAVIDEARMTATVTVVIGNLFNGTGAQLYTELPFYSSLLDLQRNLTITKKLTSGTDATSTFNINITKNGSAYSGSYKLNGTAATTTTGIIAVHQNDVITIEGLRVGENVAVFETDIPFNYEFSKATLGSDDNTNVASESSTGYAYTVSENTALKIWNAPITYHYSITYAYDSYRGLHKTQKYRVTGDFDKNTAQVADYLKVSNTVYDDDTKTNVTSYWFKDDTARKNFINILGPYENNYMEKLYWNTNMKSATNTEGVSIVYNSSKHTYTIDVNVVASKQKFVDLTFRLPYNHGVRDTAYAATETDGKVLYNNALPDETISNLDYGTWFAQNGVKYGEEGVPQYVSAPMVIYKGEQPMGFKYWTVKTVAKDSYPSVEYTKCYYHDFNLSIYQDSIVEPHYENITAEQAANYHPNPHDVAIAEGNANGAVVTFLENSRNQYNVTNNNITQSSRKNKGDRIYTDFLLSYASEGDLKFQDYANGEYTAGLAIQKVALLDNKTGGEEGKNTDSAYYADKYGNTLDNMKYKSASFSKTTLENFIKGSASYNDDIGLERSQFDANKLDNKNRIQYYYSYSVRSHTDLTDNGNKDYVYRAFAYMKDKNGNVTMVSQPLYFTFYDMASIANAQVGYNSDFPNP